MQFFSRLCHRAVNGCYWVWLHIEKWFLKLTLFVLPKFYVDPDMCEHEWTEALRAPPKPLFMEKR